MCVVRVIRSIIHTRPRSLHSDSRSDLDQDAPTSDDAASKTQTTRSSVTPTDETTSHRVNSPIRNPDIASLRVLAFIQLDLSTKARVESRGRARRQTLYSRDGKRTKAVYPHQQSHEKNPTNKAWHILLPKFFASPSSHIPKAGECGRITSTCQCSPCLVPRTSSCPQVPCWTSRASWWMVAAGLEQRHGARAATKPS